MTSQQLKKKGILANFKGQGSLNFTATLGEGQKQLPKPTLLDAFICFKACMKSISVGFCCNCMVVTATYDKQFVSRVC